MSYLLNEQQKSDLLTRHPEYQTLIQNALSSGYWPNGNQVCPTQDSTLYDLTAGWLGTAGSPTAIGYNITDSIYGTITLACDASGVIQYNADTPVATSVMNQAPYQSPVNPAPQQPGCPGWSNISSFNDFLACTGDVLTTAKWLIVLYVGYQVYKGSRS